MTVFNFAFLLRWVLLLIQTFQVIEIVKFLVREIKVQRWERNLQLCMREHVYVYACVYSCVIKLQLYWGNIDQFTETDKKSLSNSEGVSLYTGEFLMVHSAKHSHSNKFIRLRYYIQMTQFIFFHVIQWHLLLLFQQNMSFSRLSG